jgi:undecaprenyl-diphosphatase
MLASWRSSAWARFHRPRLPAVHTLLQLALVGLAISAFVLLGRLYSAPALTAFDTAALRFAQDVRSPWLDEVARGLSAIGSELLWLVWVPIVLALLVLRKAPSAVALALVALGVTPLNGLLKGLYQRARPSEWGSGVQAFSFPSGHAMAAGAVFGMLAILAWRELSGAARWLAVCVCVGMAVAIALTRPYLGVHYPTDVLAGLLAGALWADLVVLGWRTAARATRDAPRP